MTIVDQQHGSEAVTSKGKVYKFDAPECMIRFIHHHVVDYAYLLVNDFDDPGKLIDAHTATFLISKAIPSPMGAYLSAFSLREKAAKIQATKGGELFTWDDIKERIR